MLLRARVGRCARGHGSDRTMRGAHSQHAAAPRAAWRGRNSGPRVSLPGHRGARPAAGRTLPAAPARGEGGARRSHTVIGMSGWDLGHTSAAARRDRVLGPYLMGSLRVVRPHVWPLPRV